MGKHGPCCHCGITSTPLWRNGPLEKPVLCNACGSRWRTKGTLSNYTPLHAREPIEWEEPKVTKMKSIYFKTTEQKLHKRRQINAIVENAREIPFSESGQNYIKTFEGDAGNRSSSESEISYSESCGNMGAISASDYAGSAQSNAWDSLVLAPSKNKTTIKLIPSPVEKLTMDLYSIWHEQQSSNLSGSLEEDLLFEGKVLMGSVEIGHGGILLRYPSSKAVEEESEASSVTADKNLVSESYSRSSSSFVDNERNRTSLPNPSLDKFKKSALRVTLDHATSERFSSENLNMLQNWDSPLRPTDLKASQSSSPLFQQPIHPCKWMDIKNKRPTRVKKGESMSNLFRHVDLTPIVTPYESQNLQLQEFKNYMKNPKRVCRPSSSKLCLRKPSILNSSDAGSTELRGAEDSLGNEGICVSPGSLFASSPDKSSVLQFIGKSSNEDLPLHVHCSASYSEVENLYWNQMMATNSSMSESCAASEEENL